jgi:hypothetical protein
VAAAAVRRLVRHQEDGELLDLDRELGLVDSGHDRHPRMVGVIVADL